MGSRVLRVEPDVVLPLRHAVLRTGRPWADALYELDEHPLSAHFAAFPRAGPGAAPGAAQGAASGEAIVLAAGSVLPEAPDWEADWLEDEGLAWRVRGMATRRDLRGSGLGSRVLTSLLAHVRTSGGGLVWCTARLGALSLYERAGFAARGEPGLIAGLGAHQTMWTQVD
jgi:GNAT superfamily N-acetyltransferase